MPSSFDKYILSLFFSELNTVDWSMSAGPVSFCPSEVRSPSVYVNKKITTNLVYAPPPISPGSGLFLIKGIPLYCIPVGWGTKPSSCSQLYKTNSLLTHRTIEEGRAACKSPH